MTVTQLLEHADSKELTEWFLYFEVKAENEAKRRRDAEFDHRIARGA